MQEQPTDKKVTHDSRQGRARVKLVVHLVQTTNVLCFLTSEVEASEDAKAAVVAVQGGQWTGLASVDDKIQYLWGGNGLV